jgi:hypothetical protein
VFFASTFLPEIMAWLGERLGRPGQHEIMYPLALWTRAKWTEYLEKGVSFIAHIEDNLPVLREVLEEKRNDQAFIANVLLKTAPASIWSRRTSTRASCVPSPGAEPNVAQPKQRVASAVDLRGAPWSATPPPWRLTLRVDASDYRGLPNGRRRRPWIWSSTARPRSSPEAAEVSAWRSDARLRRKAPMSR